jgi:single-strand DNA-binding protein
MNKFFGVGYLVSDLESRQVGDKVVVNGAIAISRKYAIDKTDFVNMSIWGKSAEYALKYSKKGSMVAIHGELQIDKKGEKIYTKVNVEDFKIFNKRPETSINEDLETKKPIDLNDFFKDDDNTNLPF